MLCILTHSAGRILDIYHIVIFERSHVTVRNTQACCHIDALLHYVDLFSLIDVDVPD